MSKRNGDVKINQVQKYNDLTSVLRDDKKSVTEIRSSIRIEKYVFRKISIVLRDKKISLARKKKKKKGSWNYSVISNPARNKAVYEKMSMDIIHVLLKNKNKKI